MVKAYFEADDPETAVPVDVIEISKKQAVQETAIALFPNENFIIRLIAETGETQTIPVMNKHN